MNTNEPEMSAADYVALLPEMRTEDGRLFLPKGTSPDLANAVSAKEGEIIKLLKERNNAAAGRSERAGDLRSSARSKEA